MTSHPIPALALDQPLAIVGTVGAGKTFAAKSAVERLLHEGRRVIIVDPTGVWHGLRTMADGSAGFPVVIFGGEQADVPVSPDAGAALGTLLAGDRVTQAIIDVSEMTGGERTSFLTAMLERLYAGARLPRHLIMDEADELAPQQPLPEQRRLLGIVDKIVRRGRVRGFRPMMITQRPAVIHKNVLSQIATLIALRLTSPQDRKAVEDWVKGAADVAEAKKVLESLPRLGVGEGWVWAPRESVLKRCKFPGIATLDTSATPDVSTMMKTGAPTTRAKLRKEIDIAALKDALAAARPATSITKAEGPRLDREAEAAAEKRGYERGRQAGQEEGRAQALSALGEIEKAITVAKMRVRGPFPMPGADVPPIRSQPKITTSPNLATAAPKPTSNGAALPPARQRVLDRLAWFREVGIEPVERARVCVMVGLSPKASTFSVYVSELTRDGLIEAPSPGMLALTKAGRDLAAVPKIGPDAGAIARAARAQLKPQPQRVFDLLVEAFPDSLRRDALADQLGLSRTASTLGVYISELSSRGFAETAGAGKVRAAPFLFPEAGQR